MRLHRFFVQETIADHKDIVITDEAMIHQWKRVFRYVPNDSVILFDNSGYEYTATISYIEPKEARLTITKTEQKSSGTVVAGKPDVHIFASLTKKDTFEWMLEKATELGVARVTPIISERSEKKGLNLERAKKILVEASEQSGRVIVPRLYEIAELADALGHYDMPKIAFDPTGEKMDVASLAKTGGDKDTVALPTLAVFIGPEGGWSPAELELFKQTKTPIYSLGAFAANGSQVLRAETAAIAILSLLLL